MSPDSSPTRRRQILAVLNAGDATLQGSHQINVISHDTDVFLLLTAHKPHLCEVLWMFSATARKKCYVPIHQIPITEDTRESLLAIATRLASLLVWVKICMSLFDKHHHLLEHLGGESIANNQVLFCVETFVYHFYNLNTNNVPINHERVASFRQATKSLDSLPTTQNGIFSPHQACAIADIHMEESLGTMPCSSKSRKDGILMMAF